MMGAGVVSAIIPQAMPPVASACQKLMARYTELDTDERRAVAKVAGVLNGTTTLT